MAGPDSGYEPADHLEPICVHSSLAETESAVETQTGRCALRRIVIASAQLDRSVAARFEVCVRLPVLGAVLT